VDHSLLGGLFLLVDLVDLLLFAHGVEQKVLFDEDLADFGKLASWNLSISITI
jgi:hypothetical protein